MPVAAPWRGMCFLLPAGKTGGVSRLMVGGVFADLSDNSKNACSFIVLPVFEMVEMNTPERQTF